MASPTRSPEMAKPTRCRALPAATRWMAARADIMQGGDDNDTYIVDDPGDTAVENPGAGIDLVVSSVAFTLGADVET